jgi:endonuclease/exonuclease/phosphatase family metal-dependent hydrolase
MLLSLLPMTACLDLRTLGGDVPDWSGWPEGDALASDRLRIATWNVELLEAADPVSWPAVIDVLRRIDADVVALNEIDLQEVESVHLLAETLGYPIVRYAPDDAFGEAANAVLSRLEEVETRYPTSADLSGDPDAYDMTRLPVIHTARVPVTGQTLSVVATHLKSGDEGADPFRRLVDAHRSAGAVASVADSDLRVVMGDFNAEIFEIPAGEAEYTELPADLPGSYDLGQDLQQKVDAGLKNDVFAPFLDQGLLLVDARQRDGEFATRPVSGRRLDYMFVNDALAGAWLRSEVFDSRDEALTGIADVGEPVGYNKSNHASDHLPVLIEIKLIAPEAARTLGP